MKTISLEEAKKLATNSLLYADGSDLYDRDGDRLFVSTDFDKPSHDKETATAALLAHCWNTHDELVEALECHALYDRHADECKSRSETSGPVIDEDACTCWVKKDRAVLARTKTVEVP